MQCHVPYTKTVTAAKNFLEAVIVEKEEQTHTYSRFILPLKLKDIMKKTFYAILALAAVTLGGATACSDTNDLPDVSYNISLSGGQLNAANGTLYVVRGDTLKIDSISVTNNEPGKAAAITDAAYYWDYNFIGVNPFMPYGYKIYIDPATPTGGHDLSIKLNVVAVDKTPAFGIVDYPVIVLSDSTQLPSNPVKTVTATASLNN